MPLSHVEKTLSTKATDALTFLVTKMRINWLQELDGILLPMSQKWHFTKNYVNSGWEELLNFGVPLLLPQHM